MPGEGCRVLTEEDGLGDPNLVEETLSHHRTSRHHPEKKPVRPGPGREDENRANGRRDGRK